MKKLMTLLLGAAALFGAADKAQAAGWPANFEGVLLQGFYWDSYADTKWTTLEANADEYSRYFKLIWVPNSARGASNGMGYDPVYWFTNHNTRFGTEAQVRQMIQTYKAKGVGIIADVVINHRSGKSNWTDFPEETWNGQTWKIGLDGICKTDEVNKESNQAHGTGANDTGEDFNGARDLDHTNANVQNNCKNYCKFLLEDMGYAGFRYDMCKGYGGQYNKIYNEYSNPTYSVGEYWDGSYDALAAWINKTGKTSAAFDFAFKYQVNKAFANNNMTELVWKANGTTNQPAGLIHFGYQQYAVTFIDNHDTYRDGNKFTGNVVAANAFMLCSPGTPCVFLPHWKEYKTQIADLINVRNKVGVHNMSTVNVLRATNDCYMAEVTGTKGKLVVKIGSAQVTPSGWSTSQIYCSGDNYCVWATVQKTEDPIIDPTPDPTPATYPEKLYLQGHVNGCAWSPSKVVEQTSAANGVYTFKNITVDDGELGYGFFAFCTSYGADWDADVNSSDRYGAATKDALLSTTASIKKFEADVDASACNSWKVKAGKYDITADLANMTVKIATPAGVGELESDGDCAPRYFTLLGVEVTDPAPGIYVVVRGSKVSKELVR